MEYVQLTLEDYQRSKKEIKENLGGIVKSFVRIGWQLTRINATGAYAMDGYKSIAEFAQNEYGMTPDGVSRFMSVYEKYSVPGDTPELQERYRDFKFAQLTEMLQLTEEDKAIIEPEAQRASIRELKKFNKENENNPDNLLNWQQEPQSKIEETITEFYRVNRELTEEMLSGSAYREKNIKALAELINPSGNRSFKKSTVFLMMYGMEKGIIIKEFGQGTSTISWEEFIKITEEIFRGQTYAEKFKVEEKPPVPANAECESEAEEKKNSQKSEQNQRNVDPEEPKQEKEEEKLRKEEHSEEETGEEKDEEEKPDMDGTADQTGDNDTGKPERTPETEPGREADGEAETEIPQPEVQEDTSPVEEFAPAQEIQEEPQVETAEVIEKIFGSRKDYLNTLSEVEAAAYMHRSMIMEKGPDNIGSMLSWQKWFSQKVDKNGQEVAK